MNTTVFIIDDDSIFRLVVQRMIHNLDQSIVCRHCENGAVGLAALATLNSSTDNIIVLLDINMSVLSGWGFLNNLANIDLASFFSFTLYIVTSSTDERDKLRAQSYPVIKKLYHKPLSKLDLREILTV